MIGTVTPRREALALRRDAEARKRADLAEALAEAIAAAHPADARHVLAAALLDLTPDPAFRFDPVREDARFWSRAPRPVASFWHLSRAVARIRNPDWNREGTA